MSATALSVRSAVTPRPAALRPVAPRPVATDISALVRAAAGSDDAAWQTLVERYTKKIHCIARLYRLCDADVADVSQTVWLRLLQHIGRLRDPERVGAWLSTTTHNECRHLCRQGSRIRLVDDPELFEVEPAEPERAQVENEDRDAYLRGAVDALPPRQRAVLDLLMADPPASYGDIAGTLDMPIGSIGPTRRRGLMSLQVGCRAAGVSPA